MEIEIIHLDRSIYDNNSIKVAVKKGNTNTFVSLPPLSMEDLKLFRNTISFYLGNGADISAKTPMLE